jgi:uncharacterized protein (DUF427 family)
MTNRPVKQPTADHPITIEPTRGRVQVRVNGAVVADTRAALGLREASYPVVQYIPMADVDQKALAHSNTHTYCQYKGEASYYSLTTAAGDTLDDVIWTYEQPYPAVADIAGHVAFYPNKADISVESD